MNAGTPSSTGPDGRRYSTVAATLHWIIAAAILTQIGLGWWMGTLGRAPFHRTAEGWHISLGLTVLILTVARLAWRLTRPAPPLSNDLPPLERNAAHVVHFLFYVLLFALPLSGWFMESMGPRPIPFWGLAWPHFPQVAALTQGADVRTLKKTIEQIHGTPLVWAMIALIVLHVAGAVKHQFDGRPVLWRMAPWMRRP